MGIQGRGRTRITSCEPRDARRAASPPSDVDEGCAESTPGDRIEAASPPVNLWRLRPVPGSRRGLSAIAASICLLVVPLVLAAFAQTRLVTAANRAPAQTVDGTEPSSEQPGTSTRLPSSVGGGGNGECSHAAPGTMLNDETTDTSAAGSEISCGDTQRTTGAGRHSAHSRELERAAPSLRDWALNYLRYAGARSVTASSPRVVFLEHWAQVEGIFNNGNPFNPLATKYGIRGDQAYSRFGVRAYPTLSVGYAATFATMEQHIDKPILAALRDPASSTQTLGLALAESDWTGFGAKSWAEQLYAAEVAHVPLSSFHLPLPTVSFRGRVVDSMGRVLGDVCVSALSPTARSKGVLTSPSGVFSLNNLPRAAYRLQILDCRHVAGNESPVYYDAQAPPRHTAPSAAHATVLSSRCAGIKACSSQHFDVRAPIEFGILSPKLTWPAPAPVRFGTALSEAQLDARASVPGTYTYSPSRGAVLGPGEHAIAVTFRPRDRRDYSPTKSTTHLRVTRGVPLVEWPVPATIAEGTPLSATQLDASSTVAGRFTYLPGAGTILEPGVHALTVRFQPKDQQRYRATIETVTINVTTSGPP